MKEKFIVTGMSCSACSTRVEKTVSKLEGVLSVSVNLLTGKMDVEFDEERLQVDDICSAVEKAGYGARPEGGASGSRGGAGSAAGARSRDGIGSRASAREEASKEALEQAKAMKIRLIASICFLIPLMVVSMGHMFTGGHGSDRPLTLILVQILLLIPIVSLNKKYFVNGIPSLLRGGPNMDSLVAVGSSAAILYGIFAVFRIVSGYETGNMELVHQYSADIYFESAGTILTLITVGKYLESKSKGKTSQAIEKLMDLAPKMARVLKDGKEVSIPTEDLVIGDVFLVRPGEGISADGVILEGSSGIDESAITGESIPVEKGPGDRAISATMNKTGFLKIRCDKAYEDNTINQIIRLVEEASGSKAPIARMADKIAGIFVPTVMVIALLAAVIWLIAGADFEFALSIGIAVLVISCPCALGLATPVAIMVGTGKGAENGILIKSGQALETVHSIDTVVMDKTGTITEGKPRVKKIIVKENNGEDKEALKKRLMEIAAAIEEGSEHPLAEAISSYAKEKKLDVPKATDFEALFGKGIKALIGRDSVLGGNALLMEENNVDISEFKNDLDEISEEGMTPLIFAVNGEVAGIVAARDTEKEGSEEAISEFEKMNIDVVMLTGDNEKTARAIGKKLGISRTIAGVLPKDKESHIAKLQSEGHKVAMIGDGINDAPALAKADVGIAIGAGTDVAMESADAVLMRSDLRDAVTAVKLSKAVIKNIKENLFWAFFYNIIGIPIAAGVLYPMFEIKLSPMFGAAAMSLSSVCVVSNALRLKRFKIKREREIVKEKETEIMKYELKIEGMMCAHCEKHMSDALNAVPGVKAEVSQPEGIAKVEADHEISREEFAKIVEEAGYTLV